MPPVLVRVCVAFETAIWPLTQVETLSPFTSMTMSFQSPAFSTPFVPFATAQIDPVGYSGSVALMLASMPDSQGPGLLPSGAARRVARGIGSRRNTPLFPPAVTRNFTASRKSVKSFSVISQLSPSRRPLGSWRASSTPFSTTHFESSTWTQPDVSLPLNRWTGALSAGGVAAAGTSGADLQPSVAIAAVAASVNCSLIGGLLSLGVNVHLADRPVPVAE